MLALTSFVFAFAVFALNLPRSGWALFGAALMFALAGYAFQGSPGQGGAPRAENPATAQDGTYLVAMRRSFFDEATLPSRFVVTADGFARRGRYDTAAQFLDQAVQANPNDAEGWVALGNALTQHAEGQMGPAALLAFRRAQAAAPDNPAPLYFTGWAWLQAGEPERTLVLWESVLEQAPTDADWADTVRLQLARLEALEEARSSGRFSAPSAEP